MTSTAEIVAPTAQSIARAAAMIRDGQLVVFPTETVYGLGGDATNDLAVARIFEAKGRPQFNPLIAHGLMLPRREASPERNGGTARATSGGAADVVLPAGRMAPCRCCAVRLDLCGARAVASVAQALLRATDDRSPHQRTAGRGPTRPSMSCDRLWGWRWY
jgi:L-threonylcarbamoyladenylate synthase